MQRKEITPNEDLLKDVRAALQTANELEIDDEGLQKWRETHRDRSTRPEVAYRRMSNCINACEDALKEKNWEKVGKGLIALMIQTPATSPQIQAFKDNLSFLATRLGVSAKNPAAKSKTQAAKSNNEFFQKTQVQKTVATPSAPVSTTPVVHLTQSQRNS